MKSSRSGDSSSFFPSEHLQVPRVVALCSSITLLCSLRSSETCSFESRNSDREKESERSIVVG